MRLAYDFLTLHPTNQMQMRVKATRQSEQGRYQQEKEYDP